MSGTLKLSDLLNKKAEELIAKLKEMSGDKFNEEDVKDKEPKDLAQMILDKDFETRHATLLAKEPKELVKEIEKLRDNEKNIRTKHNATKAELDKVKNSIDDDEMKKLVEDNKVDEVVAKLRTKVDTLTADNKALKAKAEAYDNLATQERDEIKTKLGDKYLAHFDNMEIAELRETAKVILGSTENGSGDDKDKTKEKGIDTYNKNQNSNQETTSKTSEEKIMTMYK